MANLLQMLANPFGMMSINPSFNPNATKPTQTMPVVEKASMGGGFMDKVLARPEISDALIRMGGNMLQANAKGAGFGGSLGAGAIGFADAMDRAGANQLTQLQIQNEQKRLQDAGRYGIQSGGFEGDIARARAVLANPNSNAEDRATAQAVMETAQRMQGSYDPVTGDYRFNPRTRFGDSLGQAAQPAMPAMPPVTPPEPLPAVRQPVASTEMLPAPSIGQMPANILTPPPVSGQSGDMRMFPQTGNRKVDAQLMGKAGELQLTTMKEKEAEARKRIADASLLAGNAEGVLTKLDEAEQALQNFRTGFGGNIRGMASQAAAMVGGDETKAASYETIDRLAKELGAEGLKQFGGSDTQMELKVAIETAINPTATPESNRKVIEQKRAAMKIIGEKPVFFEQYLSQNGSLEGVEKAWQDYQKQQWATYRQSNPVSNNTNSVNREELIKRLRGQ